MMLKVYNLLYHLGITANYTGFRYIAYAVALCVTQPERLQLVTKRVYPEVAKQYGTNWKAVERNIRAVNRREHLPPAALFITVLFSRIYRLTLE